LFHELAKCCADTLIGGKPPKRTERAWTQVYRCLDHGYIRVQCENKVIMRSFSKNIQEFADVFITMQTNRHESDYDPNYIAIRLDVLAQIDQVNNAIENLNSE
jgi:hypothetical protein